MSTLFLLLVVPMLSADRAEYNDHRVMQALGWWGVPVRCVEADVGSFVCVATRGDQHAVMRCAGTHRDTCTFQLYGRKR